MWLHIDGAYGAGFAILPEHKWLTNGWSEAGFHRRQSAQKPFRSARFQRALRARSRALAPRLYTRA